jgi:hypothetical protein
MNLDTIPKERKQNELNLCSLDGAVSEEVLQNTSTPVDTRGYRDIFHQEYPQPEVLTIKIGQGLRDVKGATNMHRANDYYSNAGF